MKKWMTKTKNNPRARQGGWLELKGFTFSDTNMFGGASTAPRVKHSRNETNVASLDVVVCHILRLSLKERKEKKSKVPLCLQLSSTC